MQPTNKIGYLLQHVSFVLARQVDQALQERLGIGFSQYKILMMLQWCPEVQQQQIADSLGQTEASISRQIKLLIKKDLLTTRISPTNRRVHLATPTPKGIKLTEAARDIFHTVCGPMYDTLTVKQQAQLLETLGTMHDFVCQPGKTAACGHPIKL